MIAQGRPLTPRQAEVYAFLREFFETNDQLPPIATIAQGFGVHRNAVYDLLATLVRKGWVERNAVGKLRFKREPVATLLLREVAWPPAEQPRGHVSALPATTEARPC